VAIAVVTGAAQGIGEAIARALHADGHRVLLADLQVDAANTAARRLDPAGEDAVAYGADVRDLDAVRGMVEAARRRWDEPVGILVNNAARTVSRPLWEIDAAEWDDVLAVNLRSVLFGCQAAGPPMLERGWGRIINIASLAGQQGGAVAGAHYAASKAGVLVLTKIVARELATAGVTVNAIAPAAVRTPVMDELPADRVAGLAETIPVGRLGVPDDVGALAAFLASDSAGFITGACVDVNGGLFMR
jgi:3-oxoacyl-[acyl-carrier protein] reductase